MSTPVLDLTQALIARPSVTPDDAGCLGIIGARLAAAGFRLEAMPFGDVSNLWACHGQGPPVFCFAGHTDVVPPGDPAAWTTPPFEPTIRDGRLFGRGAADMKGSLAAMVVAAERFVASQPMHRGTLTFLLTSDEEGVAHDGTRRVVDALLARGMPLTLCLVGEPSSQRQLGDLLRNGRRGSLNGRLHVQGIQGHVAYPERALNPIHRAAGVLATLADTTWDAGNAYFPATSFQVSNLHAGTGAENVIPATLEAWFNFRFSTASTADDLKRRVHAICDAAGLDYRIDWQLSGEPFLTTPGVLLDAVTESIRHCLGREPVLSTGGGTSDGRFIAKTGCEVIELGPINATIHQVDECVAVGDLEPLARVYADILERLLRAD